MQIGIWIDDERPFPAVVAAIERAATAGFSRAWVGERAGWDPLTLLAGLGNRAPGIGLGTAVTTLFPRHPLTLAAAALTAQAATGGRLALGLGPSHQPLVEGRFGYKWERPARHVEEYLDVLGPVLAGAPADVHGEHVTAAGGVSAPGVTPPAVLLAAHGPRMLAIAGERADGVITGWSTPEELARTVVPTVSGAAGGRAPQVVVGVVASLTSDPDAARAWVDEVFAPARELPSYRDSLRRQGLRSPADTIVAGPEKAIEDAVRRYADAGVTEFQLCPIGPPADRERTVEFFAGLATATASGRP